MVWSGTLKDAQDTIAALEAEVERLRDELADLRGDGFPEEPEWTL